MILGLMYLLLYILYDHYDTDIIGIIALTLNNSIIEHEYHSEILVLYDTDTDGFVAILRMS